MKRLLSLAVLFLLAGCNDSSSTSNNAASPSTSEEVNAVETTDVEQQPAQNDEKVEQDDDAVTTGEIDEVEDVLSNDADVTDVSALIASLHTIESYESVKQSEHIVEGRPDDSYRYKETLRYVKQPHETHYIYESHNPVYMEIYANETDGIYVNDDEANPNWTYSLDEDTIDMWQEEPLPDTAELLLQIVDEHSSVDVTNNEFEIVVSMPSTELDALLGGGDSDPPFYIFSTITCNIVANGGFIDSYTIVGDYVTQDDAVGQFIVEEQFANRNNIPHVRVPAAVKDIAILEDMSIEWNE